MDPVASAFALPMVLCVGAAAGLALSGMLYGSLRGERLHQLGGALLATLALWIACQPGGPLGGWPAGAGLAAGLATAATGAYTLRLLGQDRYSPLRRPMVPLMVLGLLLGAAHLFAPAGMAYGVLLATSATWLAVLSLGMAATWPMARSADTFARLYLIAMAPLPVAVLVAAWSDAPAASLLAGLASAWLAVGLHLASAEQQRLTHAAQLMDMELMLSSTSQLVETMQQTSIQLEHQLENSAIDVRNSRIQLEEAGYHDRLTGLPNRRLLADRFAGAVSRARRSKKNFALVVVDVDHLKAINDKHGHTVGDQVLRTVARRIDRVKRDSDTFARIDSDDFVLLLHETETEEGLRAVCEKVLEAVRPLFELDGLHISVRVSLGAAVYNPSIHAIDALYTAARKSLRRAKAAGGDRYELPVSPEAEA